MQLETDIAATEHDEFIRYTPNSRASTCVIGAASVNSGTRRALAISATAVPRLAIVLHSETPFHLEIPDRDASRASRHF